MRIATILLYDDEHVSLPWEKAEDSNVWSHEITEMEASRLIPSCCGFHFIGGPNRCCELCVPEHQFRISDEGAWPPPHMFASIAFGCGIELKDGWLTLNADQCWCVLKTGPATLRSNKDRHVGGQADYVIPNHEKGHKDNKAS